jgi:hypothetical protein
MSTAEDGHEELIHDLLLTDDDLADLLAKPTMGLAELFDGLNIGSGNGLDSVHGWMLIRVVGHVRTPDRRLAG